MFRSEKPANPTTMKKTAEPVSPGKINSIMEGTSIVGEVNSDSNIRIDGKVKGTVTARGRVIVGQTGTIEGEVICQSSDIEGTGRKSRPCPIERRAYGLRELHAVDAPRPPDG